MKILIFGGGGQVANALVATTPDDWDVVTKARRQVDITNYEATASVIELESPDIVINAAAYTAVDNAELEEQLAYRVNAEAVAHLADVCASKRIQLVHFSTDFVFDGSQSVPYGPQADTCPVNIYGASKRAGEILAMGSRDNLVIRTAWVYGNDGKNFVKTMLRLCAEQNVVRVVADQIGTPTHARSLSIATWALLAKKAAGLHHFTDAGVASWFDFAVAIQEEALSLGLLTNMASIIPISSAEFPTRARRPAYSVLDKSETWRLLGNPAQHWRAELRNMLNNDERRT